jgi:DNA-binding transcriptional LysR family regulator
MNKLKHMKTFMLVAQEKSITEAAKILRITKAAASKQILELEKSLKTQLLHRLSHTLRLTDSGMLFYKSLKNVFSAVADAEAVVNEIHKKPVGTLRIACHRYFGEKIIINNLREFSTLYPDLRLDVELGDRFPDMEKENFDILCGIDHEGPDHLVRKKILTTRQILCATPQYLAKYGTPKTPDDLKNHRFITHSFRSPDNVLIFKNNKEVILDFKVRVNDAQAMLKCALQDIGFIKIFSYFIDEYLKSGRLVEILKDNREAAKSIYIFYQQRKFLPNKIRVFIDFICKKIAIDNYLLKK